VTRRGRPGVEIGVDGDRITVRGVGQRATEWEHFTREVEDLDPLRVALRSSRALRPGRRCDVNIVLETAAVVLDVIGAAMPAGTHGRAARSDDDPGILRTRLTDPQGHGVAVQVDRRPVDRVVAALSDLRADTSPRLELGPLARVRSFVAVSARRIAGRPGIVLDVSGSAVALLELDGISLVAARFFPRLDAVRSVARLLPAALERLPLPSRPAVRHPAAPIAWLHLAGTIEDWEPIEHACAQALPEGGRIDIARSVSAERRHGAQAA
jgi:catechol 2,3-dioxygenase-like lactoylglutathione lyase family enzyme